MKEDFPRLVPVWLWVTVIIIIVLLCSSCRGGRALSGSSAGTIIVPQTPQQINEQNKPRLEPLPPLSIVHPPLEPVAPQVKLPPAGSIPVIPAPSSVKVNPVIINPKPSGELKPFKPKASVAPRLIAGDGERVVITPDTENRQSNDKIIINKEKDTGINWLELFSFYFVCIAALLIGWIMYDFVRDMKTYWKNKKKKITPRKKRPKKTRSRTAKRIPKK